MGISFAAATILPGGARMAPLLEVDDDPGHALSSWPPRRPPTPRPPVHKHYEESKQAEKPAPDRRARAPAPEPRRPHLPGDDEVEEGPALRQPGREPRLRLQPRGGGPRLPRGRAPRSELRHVLLGPGLRAGTEHQRPHVARRRAEGLRAGPEGRGHEGQGHAAGARLHRRRGQALHRPQGRPGRREQGLCGRDGGPGQEVSRRPRRPDHVRGVAHGPAPLELLDGRRPALSRDGGDRGHPREACWPATRTTRERTTSTSTPWRRRRAPSGRRPPRTGWAS